MHRIELIICGLVVLVATVCWVRNPGEQELLFELTLKAGADTNQLIVRAANPSSKAMTIVGCQSSCSCGYITGLPISIPSGETIDLGLVLSSKYFDTDDPSREISITFFLDGDKITKQEVNFQIKEFFDRHRSSMSR